MQYPSYRQALPLLMAFVAVFFTACDFNDVRNPADKFKLVIGLEPVNTTVAAAFYDANSKALVSDELKLTFEGKDAGAVIDLFSDPAPTLTVKGGVISFGLRNEVVPADGSPVAFDVKVTGPGYIGTTQQLVLRKTGDHDVRVYLMKRDQLPATATAAKATPTGAGGATTQPITVQTPNSGQVQGQVTATVPAGTVAKTASGETLTGAITTQVVYLDPTEESVSQALPGGAAPRIKEGGQTTNGSFSAAVVMQMRMQDASGKEAATITNPVEAKLEIPATQTNPNTGAPYKAGDELTIFAYDEASQTWVVKGAVKLVSTAGAGKSGNNVQAVITLGGASLNWFDMVALGRQVGRCSVFDNGASFTLNRNGYTGPIKGRVMLGTHTVSFTVQSGNTFELKNIANMHMMWIPRLDAQLMVYIPSQPASQPVKFSPCGGGYTVNLPVPTGPLITTDFTVIPQCPVNQAVRVKPPSGSTLTYWKQGATEDTGATITLQPSNWTFENSALTQGLISISGLEQGATYNFKGFFPPNVVATQQQVITGTTKTVTMDAGAACSN